MLNDQAEVRHELETLERRIEQNEDQLDRQRAEVSELRARCSTKEVEMSKMQAAVERREDAQSQLDDLKKQIAALQQEATRVRENERPAQQQLAVAEEALRGEEERLDASIREKDAKATECMKDHAKLSDFGARLAQGSSASQRQLMADCESRAAEAQRVVNAKRNTLRERQQKISVLNQKLEGQERLKMQLQENIKCRESERKERALHAKCQKLQEDLQKLDSSAEGAQQELRRLERVIKDSEMETSRLQGSLSTVEANISTTRQQLQDKMYRRIDEEHREKLIEHKTVQMAVDDLNRYFKALNGALMKFHETKMADINKAVTELWNKTYKGSDIDGIAIKTEDEGQTSDGRRKQSYRVVMRKGDTTLDMRGRCSAGQKVLASLVIRLALAESFCVNCGILALDEPTTNLDRANIESLAAALNEIIKSRRHQKNFQLIVITHDEEFVQQIGRSENASHYFHVEKKFGQSTGAPPASNIAKMSIERFG